ncbi:MAG: sulfatase-like hydrolase/transferase [Prevotellaceae bacterium]|nr:sulfatase-like hydrolase/transferase [Prevotellaceae bacterium]
MNKYLKLPIVALICNLLLVYVLFTLTRLVFVWCNSSLYADHMSASYLMHLMLAGLRFDTTAILYLNCWMIVAFLLPLHWKENNQKVFSVCRWLYVIVNFIGTSANLCDCAYFPFTGRRTTFNVLQEFGNEGNFLTIITNEALPYWYLFVLAGVLVWGLWKLFRVPQITIGDGVKGMVSYYASQIVLLAVASGLTIGGMRGGFTTAVRPITISNANQYVDHALDVGIVLNTPFSIMRTIGKKPFMDCNYLSDSDAQKYYTPLHQPADSVQFKQMNVVVFILESFGKQAMARGYMPFLSELAHKGLSFEYSYSTGRKSIDGMPSVLSSIPSFVEPFFLTPASMNDLSGIAGELTRNKGYHSAFFHGAENGSMGFQAFAKATGFQEYYGRTEYNQDPRYHGDDDFDGTWAIWDEEFLQFYCDKMSEMKQPFVTSVFTASSHPPYAMPERYQKKYPPTNPRIFACVGYSDNALRLFFEKASKQAWFKNTVFVLTADHTSESIDPQYTCDIGRYKVPIVIYAPSIPELSGVDKERLISQADIMPTILGILGYDKPYVAFGQDVLNTKPEDTYAVNYMGENGYYQFLQGDWMIQFDGEKVAHAYRFKEDSLLTKDLKNQYPKEYENRLKSLVQQYMYRMNHNQLVFKK